MSESTGIWLTQEAYDRLSAELAHLKGPWRTEIAKKIEEARSEGDLKENGGYHAAKDEQGKQEARIRELELLLRNAVVGESSVDDGTIDRGSVIVAEIAGRETEFLLGSREIVGDSDLKVFSENSPLGEAVMGLKEGAKTSYLAPNGNEISVSILSVTTYAG